VCWLRRGMRDRDAGLVPGFESMVGVPTAVQGWNRQIDGPSHSHREAATRTSWPAGPRYAVCRVSNQGSAAYKAVEVVSAVTKRDCETKSNLVSVQHMAQHQICTRH